MARTAVAKTTRRVVMNFMLMTIEDNDIWTWFEVTEGRSVMGVTK